MILAQPWRLGGLWAVRPGSESAFCSPAPAREAAGNTETDSGAKFKDPPTPSQPAAELLSLPRALTLLSSMLAFRSSPEL